MQELETSSSCSEIGLAVSPVNLVDAAKNSTHVAEMSSQLQTHLQQTSSPPSSAVAVGSSSSCCETGRPIMTDPHTGQTVCSCQVDSRLLSYPRLATALPVAAAGLYGSTYSDQGYVSFGADHSAFYSPLNNSYDLKDGSTAAWSSLTQAAAYYSYDPTMGYPYSNGYGGMDLNGAARRKNATKEVTSTLKAWLYEHRKNPYPTKGEKIMLAIITKMTLTQVSTWFANARRRLKKENKMTWEPRNRVDDDDKSDIENDNEPSPIKDGGSSRDDKKDRYVDSCNGNLHMCDKSRDSDDLMMHHRHHSANQHGKNCGDKDTSLRSLCPDSRSCSPGSPLSLSSPNGLSQSSLGALSDPSPSPDISSSGVIIGGGVPHHQQGGASCKASDAGAKPRIWSLAHTATSNSPPLSRKSPQPSPLHHHPHLGHHPNHQGFHGAMTTGFAPMATTGAKYGNGINMAAMHGMHGGGASSGMAAQYHGHQGGATTNLTPRPDLRTWIEGAFHGASALTAMGIAAQYHGLVHHNAAMSHPAATMNNSSGSSSTSSSSSGSSSGVANPCSGGTSVSAGGTSGGITSGAMSVAAATSGNGLQDRLSVGGATSGGVLTVGQRMLSTNVNVSQPAASCGLNSSASSSVMMDARSQLTLQQQQQNLIGGGAAGLACRGLTTPAAGGGGIKVGFPPPPCSNGPPIGQTPLLTTVKSSLCSLTGGDRVGGLHSSLTSRTNSSQQEVLATAFRPVTKT